jgi:hypothetical protein
MREVLSFLVIATYVRSASSGTLMIGRSGAVPVCQLSTRVSNLPTSQQQSAGGRDSGPTAGPAKRTLEQSGPHYRQPEDRQKQETLAGFLVTLQRTFRHDTFHTVFLGTPRLDRQPSARRQQARCDHHCQPGTPRRRTTPDRPECAHRDQGQQEDEDYREVNHGWMKRIGNHRIILLCALVIFTTPAIWLVGTRFESDKRLEFRGSCPYPANVRQMT